MAKSGAAFDFIGQVVEPDDSALGRVEVWLGRKSTARANDPGPLVYVSKYASGQVGERSFGISPAVARELAALLLQAAAEA
ncbi:MAG: hypothetical protein E6H66_23185 [Betaproteobacteria bacterium]|nr:MAG: hypothetical protein E6H66_23185 [Betaproteobacteria bacterium]